MAEALLGLGSNLGDREACLAAAIRSLGALPGTQLRARSRVWTTAPWGGVDQPDFLNLCLRIETALAPADLLQACKVIETKLGRTVRERWGPREIDIDLLLMDGARLDTPELTLPHPRMAERRFVLEPLCEIAPAVTLAGSHILALAEDLRARDPAQACAVDEAATRRLTALLASA